MRYFVTVFILGLLIFLGVLLFHHPHATKPVATPKPLADYSQTQADVRLTIDGAINGDDTHRQIRITIDNNQRTLDIIGGYNGNIISTNSFSNNVTAYRIFLKALQNAGFTKARASTVTDEEGACPLGLRYTYELQNTGVSNQDTRLWNSTCGAATFNGNGTLVRQLFENQITNYDELTGDVILN